MQRAYERAIKQINMLDMASIACGRREDKQDAQTKEKVSKRTNKQTKGGVREGQM